MHIAGTIISIVGIIALVISCVMALKRMQKLQDLGFKQRQPEAYKKLKSDISSFIFMGVGILGFIVGFIMVNFM